MDGTQTSDNRPKTDVAWTDCQVFIKKLNALMDEKDLIEDGIFRLPTEAEWEYTCRAGTTSPFGSYQNLDEGGWYGINSDQKLHRVGQKLPNTWGFYDMIGNVDEWCNDWFSEYPDGVVTDPEGPTWCSFQQRINRGGSWNSDAKYCRAAYRSWGSPAYDRSTKLGFRLAKSVMYPRRTEIRWLKNVFRRRTRKKTVDIGNGITIELIWCPPGSFMMGSPTTERGRDKNETQHKVNTNTRILAW